MHLLTQLARRVRALVFRDRIARDIDEEMALHVALRQQRLEDDGLPADSARRAARVRFGNVARLREDAVDAWGWRWLDDFGQDVRYALRTFARNKAFTATAILSLGLGIGANAALFSVVDGVVLRPLPFPDADRLVVISGTSQLMPHGDNVFNLNDVRQQATMFEAIAGDEVGGRYLRRGDRTERVMAVRAEPDFFTVLGRGALLGRTFDAHDGADVAVISEGFWRRELGSDPGVLGSSLVVDDRSLTIVGVMADSFQYPYGAASLLPGTMSQGRTDMWVRIEPALTARGRFSHVTARLKEGVQLDAARGELAAIAAHIQAGNSLADTQRRGYEIVPLADAVVGTAVRRPLFLLLGAVAVVLLLACANVANLLLVRMTARHREIAVRAGLGAGPLRLARQFLAESLLLSLAGGAAGLTVAWWTTKRLLASAAAQLPRTADVNLDWRVFAFLTALCTLVGVAVGLAPVAIAVRKDTRGLLQAADGRNTMTRRQRHVRDVLVVVEIALALVLAVGAALLVRELTRLRRTDLGMETRNAITFHIGKRMVVSGREGTANSRHFYEIADRVAALPGVRAAGFTQLLPLQSWGWFSHSSDFFENGRPPLEPVFPIELRFVTPGYFRALGIRVVRGRALSDADVAGTATAIVINEALARRQFGGEDPVGRVMNRGTIVGVVADVRNVNPDRPAVPEIYYSIAQNWSQVSELGMTLVVRTDDRPEAVVDAVRSIVRNVDPQSALFEIKTMARVVDDSTSLFRLFLWLIAGFAGLAVLLATTGTYGVMSYVAASRGREFAVRMALGADRGRVARAVLGQGLTLTAVGLGCGLAAAFASAPLLADLPVSVRPPDAVTIVPVAAILSGVAVLACLMPALRAARVDPMTVLRNE